MKRRQPELVAEAIAMLVAHGITPTISSRKHFKVGWTDHGRHRHVIIPRTPSDWRARANARATLRRLLRTSEREACS